MKNIKLVTENTYLMGYNENNIVCCYYPLTKEAKELDLTLLPNPFEEDNIVNEVERIFNEDGINHELYNEKEICNAYKAGIYDGYKAAQSKQFSLDDMKKAIEIAQIPIETGIGNYYPNVIEVLEQLSTQQLPKEFIPEYDIVHTDHAPNGFEKVLKFKTNSEGKEELVGIYLY